jgi:hypothetical protein
LNYDIDHLFVVCEYAKRLAVHWGIDHKKISVQRNQIRSDICFEGQDVPNNNSRIDDSILFVGAYIKHKGLHLLLKAFASKRLAEARLFLVGSKNLWSNEEDIDLKALKKFKNIQDLGELDGEGLVSIYKKCQFIILPSKMESAGLVLLEAMSMGCVPIISNRGGMPEIVIDHYNGLMLERLSYRCIRNTLATAITQLKIGSEAYAEMQGNAFRVALDYKNSDSVQVITDSLMKEPNKKIEVSFVLTVAKKYNNTDEVIQTIKSIPEIDCPIIIIDIANSLCGNNVLLYFSYTKNTGITCIQGTKRNVSKIKNEILNKAESGIVFFLNPNQGTVSAEWIKNTICRLSNHEVDIAAIASEDMSLSWAASALALKYLKGFNTKFGVYDWCNYKLFYDDWELLNLAHNRGMVMEFESELYPNASIVDYVYSIEAAKCKDGFVKGVLNGRLRSSYGKRNVLRALLFLWKSILMINTRDDHFKHIFSEIAQNIGELILAVLKIYRPIARD